MTGLSEIAAWLNSAAGWGWLLAGGTVGTVLAAAFVAWMRRRVRRIRPVAEMADPAYNPALDRHQRILRQALRDGVDIPTDDDLDGLVIDWDDEMRRRRR